jgi:hypothetical protein
LKIFLTQIGPILPLTTDPPVICFWKRIGRSHKKSQFGECFFQKANLFLTSPPSYPRVYPPVDPPHESLPDSRPACRRQHLWAKLPSLGVKQRRGTKGGGAAAGTPDHGDSGEAAGSIEGNEGDRFPSSPWARVARGSAPTAAAIHHEVAHGGTVGVGARWCGARAVPADAGERR